MSSTVRTFALAQTLTRHFGRFTRRALLDLIEAPQRQPASRFLSFLAEERIATVWDNDISGEFYAVDDADCPPPKRAGATLAVHRQLWTAIRGLKIFSCEELRLAASTDLVQPTGEETLDYLNMLTAAGYFASVDGTFRLVASRHGPLPPMPAGKLGSVYDPNTRRTVNVTELRKRAAALLQTGRAA